MNNRGAAVACVAVVLLDPLSMIASRGHFRGCVLLDFVSRDRFRCLRVGRALFSLC